MKYNSVPLVGGYYADETRSWSSQDCVNWLPTQAEKSATRTPSMLKTPPGLREFAIDYSSPVLSGHLASAAYGTVVSYQYIVHGGSAPVTISISSGALPTGLSISSSGLVTGTMTSVGPFSWSVHAVDVDGRTDTLPDSNVVTDTIIYTSNDSTSDVYAIRYSSGALLATIPVGNTASGVAISPDGSRVYVANAGSNTVSVIDTATNAVIATITVGTNPVDVCVSKDGTRAYTANQSSSSISVIDTTSNTLISTIAKGSAPVACNTNPVNGDIYVVDGGNSTVYLLNADGSTKASVSTTNPSGVNASPDGAYFYVVGYDGITAFDATSHSNLGNLDLRGGYGPQAVVITPDGKTAYVADYNYTDLKVVNVTTKSAMSVIKSIAGVGLSTRIAMDVDGKRCFVTNTGGGLKVIDIASNTIATSYAYGNFGVVVEKVSH